MIYIGALYEDRQFIIVPGEVNVSTSANVNDTWFLECNMGTAVHVFDTYDWTFKDEFDPDNKGSKVPSAIVDLIGGDEKGNAKIQQPKAGWDNKALGSIFQTRNQLPPGTTDSVTNTTSKTPPPRETGSNDGQNQNEGNTTESKSNNTGAIVGGVVGGLAGLGLLFGLFFWWRKRQDTSAHETQPVLPELGGNGYSGAPPYYDSPYNAPSVPYVPPQELQAYEPQEMGGAGYYAPAKLDNEQGHPEGVDMSNPPPSSVYPITPELPQQQTQVSTSFVSPVSPVQSPIPTVRTGLITRKAIGS